MSEVKRKRIGQIITEKKEKVNKKTWVRRKASELRGNIPRSEQWFIQLLVKNKLDHLFINNKTLLDKYIGDFVHKSIKLIIEIDGKIHDKQEVLTKDYTRQVELEQNGYKIIRVKAYDDLGGQIVIDRIKSIIKNGFKKIPEKQKHVGQNINDTFRHVTNSSTHYNGLEDISYTNSFHNKKCYLCERDRNLKQVVALNHAMYLCSGHFGYYNQICRQLDKVAKYLKLNKDE